MFLQLVKPPHVTLKVLFVLRVDSVGFPLRAAFGKERLGEETGESVESPFEGVGGDFKVVLYSTGQWNYSV